MLGSLMVWRATLVTLAVRTLAAAYTLRSKGFRLEAPSIIASEDPVRTQYREPLPQVDSLREQTLGHGPLQATRRIKPLKSGSSTVVLITPREPMGPSTTEALTV